MRIAITASPLAIGAALLLALTACTSNPMASSTPSASATADSTPSPTTEPEAAEVVVHGHGFDIVDAVGAVTFTHEWADAAGPAVAALTEAFGSPAATSFEDNANTHFADFDVYTWPGFAFGDAVGLDKPRTDYFLPSWVRVEAASVAGVEVRARSGPGVGATVAEVAALSPVIREQWDASAPAVYRIDAADPSLTLEELSPPADPTDMVGLIADPADAVIVKLTAPELSWSPF